MCRFEKEQIETANGNLHSGERGSAIVIALFVLALISVFVALAMSRTSAEASALGNETTEGRTFYAAQGSLETMTRNFNKVFETKLNPTTADQDVVRDGDIIPGLSTAMGGEYTFANELDQLTARETKVLSGGPYSGLIAVRDNWRLRTTATAPDGTQIQLTRNILNNRIPIFQFGIFYNDDLELFRPPRFAFGGRVHSNGNFFVSPGAEGIFFDSRVTAAHHIVTQSWRNWNTSDSGNSQTWIKNASGTPVQLLPTMGSVLNTTFGNANNVFQFPPPSPVMVPNPDMPPSRLNPTWASTTVPAFDGNLQAGVRPLRLPLNVGANTDLVEMLKRGKELATATGGDLFRNAAGDPAPVTAADVDNNILRAERFANKKGIRVSLADSKAKLPGCASGVGTGAVATPCGVRLDGRWDGSGLDPLGTDPVLANRARGYRPKAMRSTLGGPFNYQATTVNGERLFNASPAGDRQVWIKIETVDTNTATQTTVTVDVTEDVLSLGVTQEVPTAMTISGYAGSRAVDNNGTASAPSLNLTATAPQTLVTTYPDSRSVIKLQTFAIPGAAIPGGSNVLRSNAGLNYVRRFTAATSTNIALGCPTGPPALPPYCVASNIDPNASNENLAHLKLANGNEAIVPFPIEMFDTREGTYFDDAARYTAGQVTRNGVMSMIDIDVANLRRFLRGDYNGLLPEGPISDPNSTPFSQANGRGLRTCTYAAVAVTPCDIPQDRGWVLYVSDRRGDGNFDGEYDMEDVYGTSPGNDGVMQSGEDLDGPLVGPAGFIPRFGAGVLDRRYINPGSATNNCLSGVSTCEAARYPDTYTPDRAAVNDHPYFRRGVRLINATVLPGIYDSGTPSNTKGLTVASENGVYVLGNYNATGAAAPPGPPNPGNTTYDQYFPFNTPTHIPASIVADAVTILSNGWLDSQSFISPYNRANRVATPTHMRFALITGDAISTRGDAGVVHQGSSVNGWKENGGVHNFKRFLEIWTGVRFDYSGSLINLFNSRNNNGTFKCCNTVYNPPSRNWVFDSTFLDPDRLPPGTPYFQYAQTTGFERATD